jgi:hypothetical protein
MKQIQTARWLIPKMVKNGSCSFFCLFAFDLGLFGEQLLTALKNGNSRGSNKYERKQSFSMTS